MNPRLIALVNDEPTFRYVVSNALARAGFAVHACSDAAAAVRIVRDEQPAAVIIETRTGDLLDAPRLVAQLRHANVRSVIVCSADPRFLKEHGRALAAQGCEIIGKPFDLATVLAALAARQPLLPIADSYIIEAMIAS